MPPILLFHNPYYYGTTTYVRVMMMMMMMMMRMIDSFRWSHIPPLGFAQVNFVCARLIARHVKAYRRDIATIARHCVPRSATRPTLLVIEVEDVEHHTEREFVEHAPERCLKLGKTLVHKVGQVYQLRPDVAARRVDRTCSNARLKAVLRRRLVLQCRLAASHGRGMVPMTAQEWVRLSKAASARKWVRRSFRLTPFRRWRTFWPNAVQRPSQMTATDEGQRFCVRSVEPQV